MAHLACGAKKFLNTLLLDFTEQGLIETVHTYFIKTVDLTFQVINNWIGWYV